MVETCGETVERFVVYAYLRRFGYKVQIEAETLTCFAADKLAVKVIKYSDN